MKKSPHEYDVYVGSRVRMARSMVSMSQTALADELGITFQQIQKYEKGTNRISAGRLVLIARILGKPINWFFEDIEAKTKNDNGLETAFQTESGSRLLRTFYHASKEQRKIIADLARTIVKGNSPETVPAE